MTLRADSKQYISPDIYSARIRPLHLEGENRYQMLRDYLKKAVAEKAKQNAFDQLTMARGHGYNSEDPWHGAVSKWPYVSNYRKYSNRAIR